VLTHACIPTSLLVLFAPAALNHPCPLRQTLERLPPLMDAKKEKTRRESSRIKVLVTPEEKAAIAAKANAHSLSVSSYLRRIKTKPFARNSSRTP
jgi:hypothetical protein